MKFTKSILRPVRATRKGGAASLSFLRGGGHQASTFFTKKRGGAFDTHEPSSPKVTCIGQVRVKSKKRVKQCRRRIGEVSFRVAEQSHGGEQARPPPQRFSSSSSSSRSHRDPRWVHLPMSALRAFGAEICCFFPCRCSCFPARQRENSTAKSSGCYANENGCGAVLTRWLVAVNGGDGGKTREIEVVVGGDAQRSFRHVFEDIEVKDEEEEEEESGRVSICVPPKNALLLMRCRSDPMKMTALATRFCMDAPKYENPYIQEDNDDFQEQLDNSHVSEQNAEQLMEVVDNGYGEEKKIDEADESEERVEEEKEEENAEELTEEETDKKAVECSEEEAEKPKNGEMAIVNKGGGLPECLLLMMCEPKLSMEVSKETWIRGTDFIRLLPERPRKPPKTGADQDHVKRRPSVDSKSRPRIPAPPSKQPARSSCSLPATSMAAVIQVSEGKCEPFVLTRCKSEPMSTAAAKLMPESC